MHSCPYEIYHSSYRERIGPELLKGDYEGYWSRRINQKDRMIYCVDNAVITVTVIQIGKHYNDK